MHSIFIVCVQAKYATEHGIYKEQSQQGGREIFNYMFLSDEGPTLENIRLGFLFINCPLERTTQI